MTDFELRAERDIARAVFYARASDLNKWACGAYASRVIGLYERHAAKAIADQAGRDVSTIENYAHAHETFTEISEAVGGRTARTMRRALTIGHFWTAWELKRKYNLPVTEIVRGLIGALALKSREEPHSADVLRQEIEADHGGIGKVLTWNYLSGKVRDVMTDALATDGTPEPIRKAAQSVLNFYGGTMDNLVQWILDQRTADGGTYARNDPNASAIVNGLRLWECETEPERLKRLQLYRDYRTSGIYGKNTAPCFEKARAGEPLPVEEMFVGEVLEGKEDKDVV